MVKISIIPIKRNFHRQDLSTKWIHFATVYQNEEISQFYNVLLRISLIFSNEK